MSTTKVSVVIPCLNESKTLPFVMEKLILIKEKLKTQFEVEILVSDNGSDDGSQDLAKRMGARVEHCEIKGYGSALDSGIKKAKGEIIIFADADDTYDFLEAPKLITRLIETDSDMVIGSRLDGIIHLGAMPFLHRYLGTPVINWIINLLYAKKTKIRDSNSGFRCFKKNSYLEWDIKSKGMEFASELLIKALIANPKIEHVPVSLYPDKPGRIPHLKTWRDGMRHLLRILFYAPYFFQKIGTYVLIFGAGNLLFALFAGNILEIQGVRFYGVHTLVLLSFFAILGLAIWNTGLLIATKQKSPKGLYAYVLNWGEDRLFFILLSGVGIVVVAYSFLLFKWVQNDFQFLNLEREIVILSSFSILLMLFGLNAITAHILKRE